MEKNVISLNPGAYYHVYNRAVGDDKLFYTEANYIYFLKKYQEYMLPIVDTFVYCLMPNHFHFLIQVKSDSEINLLMQNSKIQNKKTSSANEFISKTFSNFFNGYTQAVNIQQGRRGTLFTRPFKRKQIDSKDYLINVALYIHRNPLNHGYTANINQWKYSSYHSIVSEETSFISSNEVVEWFSDLNNFIKTHENNKTKMMIQFDGVDNFELQKKHI